MLDLASKMAGWFGLTTEDRAACVLPTYYAAGSKLNVLVPLLLWREHSDFDWGALRTTYRMDFRTETHMVFSWSNVPTGGTR